jgi:hypothetical protein
MCFCGSTVVLYGSTVVLYGNTVVLYGNTVVFSRIVYNSSAILTAWHHFNRSECFYGDSVSPPTLIYTWSSTKVLDISLILSKFGASRHIFINVSNIKFNRNQFSASRAENGQIDVHDVANGCISRISKSP